MKTRSPERDKAFKLYKKSGKTMKNSEIASKLGVSTSLVAKWKSQDKWDSDELPNEKVKSPKKGKKIGAPKGNKNAVGNKGGGAPLGTQNNLKHGGYSQIYWDTLDENEKELIDSIPQSEEELLVDQIKLFTVRERRILLAIKTINEAPGEQLLDSVIRQEAKRSFPDDKEKEQYSEQRVIAIETNTRLAGDSYNLTTTTESKRRAIARLEDELTRVQRSKNKAIETLARINLEKQKLDFLRDSKTEIEDTDETDVDIYGS